MTSQRAERKPRANALKPLHAVPDSPTATDQEGDSEKKKPTLTQRIVSAALARYRFGMSNEGIPFAVPKPGRGPNVALFTSANGEGRLKSALAKEFHRKHGIVLSAGPLNDAMRVLIGTAAESDPEDVWLRVGRADDGAVVIDIGDVSGRAVVVRDGSWAIVPRSPVVFRRTALGLPLPEPVPGGDLARLRPLLNVTEAEWDLIVAWAVAALIPDIAHPGLLINGEQGSAKSGLSKLLGDLVDPSSAPLRSIPDTTKDWAVTASGSWGLVLENVSHLSPKQSDLLCRAVTGDAHVSRTLYSDNDVTVLAFRRVIIINGIDVGGIRGDLAERLVGIELRPISPDKRFDEEKMTAYARKIGGEVLGGLLDCLAASLQVDAEGRNALTKKPRMADFARIVRAVDVVRDTDALATYIARQADVAGELAEGESVTVALREYLSRSDGREPAVERRTAEKWLDLLQPFRPDEPLRYWPSNPQKLSSVLVRSAPGLRTNGWTMEKVRSNGVKLWAIGLPAGSPAPSKRTKRRVAPIRSDSE